MLKILRVHLESEKVSEENVEKGSLYDIKAGKALISSIIINEIPPKDSPLSASNKLIIACGFLSGTAVPNSGKISIGGKSPLTGGVKESNVGGRAPWFIARMGFRAIIVEDIAKEWKILILEEGKARLDSADEVVGKNNYETVKLLLKKYGERVGIFSIGIAGEKMLKGASIASCDLEGYPSRHAGRGGLGALMGSKKLKAIVVVPPKENKITYTDKESFLNNAKDWFKERHEATRWFSKMGTNVGLSLINEHYGLPVKNFRLGRFEAVEKVSGEALNAILTKRNGKFGIACSYGCAINCSNIYLGPNGEHITSSLEYETVAMNGPNLLIDDYDLIAQLDHLEDDLGLDTIETGAALGVLMETGIIPWGNEGGKKALEILPKIANNDDLALAIGNGAEAVGKKFNISRVPTAKGQAFPAYDPRSFKGMGVTFATTPMGADHTAGAAVYGRKAYSSKEYGDVHDAAHKIELSTELQVFNYIMDCMGMCYFVGPSFENSIKLAKFINWYHGWNIDENFLINLAKEMLVKETKYNIEAGLPQTNKLPDFFKEPIPGTNRTFDVNQEELDKVWKQ